MVWVLSSPWCDRNVKLVVVVHQAVRKSTVCSVCDCEAMCIVSESGRNDVHAQDKQVQALILLIVGKSDPSPRKWRWRVRVEKSRKQKCEAERVTANMSKTLFIQILPTTKISYCFPVSIIKRSALQLILFPQQSRPNRET